MTCAALRRLLMIEPCNPALAEHARGCPGCARLLEEALGFERQLKRALGVEQGKDAAQVRPERGGALAPASSSALVAMGRRWLGIVGLRRGSRPG